jgi:vacuolar-type H+-ATPase subunit D/Vma8
MYILPVVLVSVTLNVPKFFEITVMMEYDNATGVEVPTIATTELRHEKHYILGPIL